MPPFKEPPADLDGRVESLLRSLSVHPTSKALQSQAVSLAREIRSRCIDLAIWQADQGSEYKQRVAQAAALVKFAGELADASLRREFAGGAA